MKPYNKIKLPETREEWLENRMKGIGGSDAGAILGLNPYKSPFYLWCEKTGRITNDIDNEAMRQGRDLEDYVARRWMEATGKRVHKSGFSYRSKEHPYMLANVDRLVVGENAGLECKTANALTRTRYDKGDIPGTYYAQCMHYMAVTGLDKWYLAVLVLGKEFYMFEINRDEEEIQAMIDAEEDFWTCVETDKEPPVDGTDSTCEALNQVFDASESAGSVLISDDLTSMILDIKSKQKELQTMQKEYENQVKDLMGDAVYAYSNHANITWKESVSKRFDTSRFKKENPDVYEKYLKESKTRRFLIKEIEEEEE
jgi:putative phage-type endonuclease